uniref:CRAL-TRIO domain-containing protein n=1 Tax=Glossina austeni TaxID=7395 RepID=A0A1A9VEW2_GLOAU
MSHDHCKLKVKLSLFSSMCVNLIIKGPLPENFTCNMKNKGIRLSARGSLAPLPTLTPEGYRVFMSNLLDFDASNFNHPDMLKIDGLQKGYVVIIDQTGFTLGHLSRMNVMVLKKAFYYLQEALPIQLKGVHIINVVPFLDKLLALCSPFIQKELFDILHFHNKLEDIFQYVPLYVLPKDYGGSGVEINQLHERSRRMMISKHQEIIEYEKLYRIDEKLRPEMADQGKEIQCHNNTTAVILLPRINGTSSSAFSIELRRSKIIGSVDVDRKDAPKRKKLCVKFLTSQPFESFAYNEPEGHPRNPAQLLITTYSRLVLISGWSIIFNLSYISRSHLNFVCLRSVGASSRLRYVGHTSRE